MTAARAGIGGSPVVAFAGDVAYFPGLVVSIASTLKRLPSGCVIDVLVFDEGLSADMRRELHRVVARGHSRTHLHIRPGFHTTGLSVPTPHHLTAATYARLLLPEVIPGQAAAVYLDADIFARASIEPLLRMDLGEAPIAACVDAGVSSLGSGLDYTCGELGVVPDVPYLNAGLLVLNLASWRSRGLSERVLDFTEKWASQVRYGDQDGINAACAADALVLDDSWNYQVRMEAERAAGLDGLRLGRAKVVHFNGPKPWASVGWLGGGTVALRTWAEWWSFAIGSRTLPISIRARMVRLLLRNARRDLPLLVRVSYRTLRASLRLS